MKIIDRANDFSSKFIIAIDGTSASGKGTLGKMLAKKFQMKYFASSIFYRKLASIAYSKFLSDSDINELIQLSKASDLLKNYQSDDLHDEHITDLTSKIASIPEVRDNLRPLQRHLVDDNLRVILDGRDIGTIIAPDAHIKLFIDANLEVRSERRFNQLQGNKKSCMMREVFNNLQYRDERDRNRSVSPLLPADDACFIDNSGDIQDSIEKIMRYIENK